MTELVLEAGKTYKTRNGTVLVTNWVIPEEEKPERSSTKGEIVFRVIDPSKPESSLVYYKSGKPELEFLSPTVKEGDMDIVEEVVEPNSMAEVTSEYLEGFTNISGSTLSTKALKVQVDRTYKDSDGTSVRIEFCETVTLGVDREVFTFYRGWAHNNEDSILYTERGAAVSGYTRKGYRYPADLVEEISAI